MKNWETESWTSEYYPEYWLIFVYLGDPSTPEHPNVREFKIGNKLVVFFFFIFVSKFINLY